MRRPLLLIALLALALPATSRAQWPASGLRLDNIGIRYYTNVSLVPDAPAGRITVLFTGNSNAHVVNCAKHVGLDATTGTWWGNWEAAYPTSDGGNEFFIASLGLPLGYSISRMYGAVNDSLWPSAGLNLASNGGYPSVASDGSGGAYVITFGTSTFLRRYAPAGTVAAGWPAGGVDLTSGNPTVSSSHPQLIVDASGAAVVLLLDASNDLTILRVLPDGTFDPTWVGDPLASYGPGAPVEWELLDDGTSYWAVWSDNVTHVARLDRTGTIQPGWPVTAIASADLTGPDPGHLRVFPDRSGGLYVLLQPGTYDGNVAQATYATHLLGGGAVAGGWSLPGAAVSLPGPGTIVTKTFIAGPDSLGGMFFGWNNLLTRFLGDHTIAPGWSPAGDAVVPTEAMVNGSCASGGLALGSVGAVSGDGSGAGLVVVAVYDNCNYPFQYLRLVRFTPVGLAGVASAAAPSRFGVRLLGANPAAGARRFALSLAPKAVATFEVTDVAGRVVSREFVAPLAGTRERTWTPAAGTRAGIYFARLTQRGAADVARFVMLE